MIMPTPFPGMDPFLEGYLWPDVHHRLATDIARRLMPHLRPRYVARLEVSVIEDKYPEVELGVMYPDVQIMARGRTLRESALIAADTPTLEAPYIISLPQVKITSVEIRDVADNELITSIEILSPVNKRDPGFSQYQQKQNRLRQAGVHLLEIDLLRRGLRPQISSRIPESAYRITLFRAHQHAAGVWPVQLNDPLPIVPVPLHTPDPDVPLDLNTVLHTIYDEAAYDLSIDYQQKPPPPDLSTNDEVWLKQTLGEKIKD